MLKATIQIALLFLSSRLPLPRFNARAAPPDRRRAGVRFARNDQCYASEKKESWRPNVYMAAATTAVSAADVGNQWQHLWLRLPTWPDRSSRYYNLEYLFGKSSLWEDTLTCARHACALGTGPACLLTSWGRPWHIGQRTAWHSSRIPRGRSCTRRRYGPRGGRRVGAQSEDSAGPRVRP